MEIEAKRDEAGELVLKDGEPVFEVGGKDVTASSIANAAASKARREAKGLRTRATTAEETLDGLSPVVDAIGDLEPEEAAALLDKARSAKPDDDGEKGVELATLTRRLERSEQEKGTLENATQKLMRSVDRGHKLEALASSDVLSKTIFDGLPRKALNEYGGLLKVKHPTDDDDDGTEPEVVGLIDGAEVSVDEALEHAIQHDADRDGILKTKKAKGPGLRHAKDGKRIADTDKKRSEMSVSEKAIWLRARTTELGSYEKAKAEYDQLPA